MKDYLGNIGKSVSCTLNTLRGEPWHKPICATEWQKKRDGQFNFCWFLDIFEEDHCLETWVNYELRKAKINGQYRSVQTEG